MTHVLPAGGEPRLFRLCFWRRERKKGEGERKGGRWGGGTESMQRVLIESPTAFAISGAYQAREQTAMLVEQREQRVNSHHVGIDCRISSFQRPQQSRAEYPDTKKKKICRGVFVVHDGGSLTLTTSTNIDTKHSEKSPFWRNGENPHRRKMNLLISRCFFV